MLFRSQGEAKAFKGLPRQKWVPQAVLHAAVLRGLRRRGQESLGTAETIPGTHHLIILGQGKRPEERGSTCNSLLSRSGPAGSSIERQFKPGRFERETAKPPNVSAALRQTHPDAASAFKDKQVRPDLGSRTEGN